MVPRLPSRFKISYGVRPENGSNGLPDIINCYRVYRKGVALAAEKEPPTHIYPTSLLRHYCTETNKRRKLFRAAYRITCWNKRLIEFRSAQPKALPLLIALQTLCHLLYRLHALPTLLYLLHASMLSSILTSWLRRGFHVIIDVSHFSRN